MAMFKDAHVTYPRRRKRTDEMSVQEIQEPTRKTMYDVLTENFRALKRVTFMHRVIYVGEHYYDRDETGLESFFSNIVTTVNESYTAEKLTGFLLCYTKYFMHLVEGDEDSIYKHLGLLQNHKYRQTQFGTIKLLIHVSHISRRLINCWIAYFGTPAQYLGNIKDGELNESARHIYNCIRKMYNLVFRYCLERGNSSSKTGEFRESMYSNTGTEEEVPVDTSHTRNLKGKSEVKPSILSLRTTSQFMTTTPIDPFRGNLPEYEIVDFAIKTNFTHNISEYFSLYGVVPQRVVYKDRIWPCPSDYVPYDVFSKPFDTITELPKCKEAPEKLPIMVDEEVNEKTEQ